MYFCWVRHVRVGHPGHNTKTQALYLLVGWCVGCMACRVKAIMNNRSLNQIYKELLECPSCKQVCRARQNGNYVLTGLVTCVCVYVCVCVCVCVASMYVFDDICGQVHQIHCAAGDGCSVAFPRRLRACVGVLFFCSLRNKMQQSANSSCTAMQFRGRTSFHLCFVDLS